jgi:hypothetical protein
MISPSTNSSNYTVLLIETGLTLVAIVSAFTFPRLGSLWFARCERAFTRLARRKRIACVTVAASAFFLRLALLPLFPAPLPFVPDDFSFMLAADTFAHGRLTNPTPAMWTHFESIHITVEPTYTSMYFPGPGLVLAAGKVLFGQPWAGTLIVMALACAALCWMLQAWLPPTWALLGGFLAVLRLGLFSYWINSYSGGAPIAVLGGALVLGSMPRLIRAAQVRHGLLLALGIAMLVLSRPYEGLLLCVPVAIALGHWVLRGKIRPPIGVLLRRAALPIALVAAAIAWLGYYDYRSFGNPRTLPYTVGRAEYAVAPYYIWQNVNPTPQYRNAEMRRYYTEGETRALHTFRTRSGRFHLDYLHDNLFEFYAQKIIIPISFFAFIALVPPLVMARRVLLDRRLRFFLWSLPFWAVGMGIGIFLVPHYLAPFTAAAYVLGLQAMRHLRAFAAEGAPVGRTIVRLTIVVCVCMAGLRVVAEPLHIAPGEWPADHWIANWVGPSHFGTDRANVLAELEKIPGKHLAIVRYSADHQPYDEWVYNAADIENSCVIWARDMGAQSNSELMRFYSDRDVWLVQPDSDRGKPAPYSSYLAAAREEP